MFSIIFSVLWYKTLIRAKNVTIDGGYIMFPIIADLVLANIIFN